MIQKSSEDFSPSPFVFRIRAFTSFKISFSERMYASGLYLMDFLKLIRFKHLIRYFFRSRKEPTSGNRVPFGSVQTYEEWACSRDGLQKNRVLPLPEPPITRIFLFLAYFGCFGLLDMVIRSVMVMGMFWKKSLSM